MVDHILIKESIKIPILTFITQIISRSVEIYVDRVLCIWAFILSFIHWNINIYLQVLIDYWIWHVRIYTYTELLLLLYLKWKYHIYYLLYMWSFQMLPISDTREHSSYNIADTMKRNLKFIAFISQTMKMLKMGMCWAPQCFSI